MNVPEKHYHSVDPGNTFMMIDAITSDAFKPFIIPIIGLTAGIIMMQIEKISTIGKLVLYFGAQCFMNVYISWVMRTSVTVPKGTIVGGFGLEQDLTGCPAGFALTAMQQIISFIVFWIFFASVYFTRWQYIPKKLTTCYEFFCVCCFGCVFALNIALNNFSLGYISIAINLIIRSCLPLTTFLSTQIMSMFGMYPSKPCRFLEILMMVIGVVCAGVFTTARIMGSNKAGSESSNMILGVVICVVSLLCGSLNLALAGVLGESVKLNVYDTVAYMAIPATLFLLPIATFLQKPVPGQWSKVFGMELMSDWQILMGVWGLSKKTMIWLVLSGVFSFIYNIIQFSVVHTLSPSATAFGGNFNKAALIFLTLLLPFLGGDKLPGMPYIAVIWMAVIINIAAFSYYSYLQILAKRAEEKARQIEQGLGDDFSDEDEAMLAGQKRGQSWFACCRSKRNRKRAGQGGGV